MTTSQQRVLQLKVEKLKNLDDFEIDFLDKNLTAILGANGCGKSTILHALSCCYKPINENDSTNYKFSYFFTPTTHSNWAGSKFTLFHSYRIDKIEHSNVKSIYSKEIGRWKPVYARRVERHVSFVGIKTCVPRIEEETQESLIRYTTIPLSDDVSSEVKNKAGYVMNRNYDQYNTHDTGRIKYIGVKHLDKEYSSLSMGAGEQRVFYLLTQVFRAPKHSLILIDEIDLLLHHNALHRLLEVLIDRADKMKLQIIFTTHDQSVTALEEKINIRHILQTPSKTLCFRETKPDAIYRLTGQQERPLEFFVEDDLAKAIIKKLCSELGIAQYVSIREFGAASNCFTMVAAALLQNERNIDNMLFILDGDTYKTDSDRQQAIQKVLTGDTPRAIEKREKAIGYIRQFTIPSGLKPEEYLHKLVTQLSSQENEEYNEVLRVAKDIVAVNNSHRYIDDIISRLDFERPVGLKMIIDLVSLSSEWITYTSEIRDWLLPKKQQILETV